MSRSFLPMDTIPCSEAYASEIKPANSVSPNIDEKDGDDDKKHSEVINANNKKQAQQGDSDDESSDSGFGDFCGFDLDDDLSDSMGDDEMIRPGKTYEYVNFVDPKYAQNSNSQQSVFNSSINDCSSTSSTRTLKQMQSGKSSQYLSTRKISEDKIDGHMNKYSIDLHSKSLQHPQRTYLHTKCEDIHNKTQDNKY